MKPTIPNMIFCLNLKFQRFKFAFLNMGFGCDHPIRCNRRVAQLTATVTNDYDTITQLSAERNAFRDARDRFAIDLNRCNELADFAITSIEEDDPDATAELLSDLREVVHRAVG